MTKTIFRGLEKKIQDINIEDAKRCFINKNLYNIWSTGDGGIEYYIDGKERYYLTIGLSTNTENEFMLEYKDNEADGYWCSVGNFNTLDEWQEFGNDFYARRGTFLTPEETWLAVEDFLKTGQMSNKINWINADDLPEEKYPNPAS